MIRDLFMSILAAIACWVLLRGEPMSLMFVDGDDDITWEKPTHSTSSGGAGTNGTVVYSVGGGSANSTTSQILTCGQSSLGQTTCQTQRVHIFSDQAPIAPRPGDVWIVSPPESR